MSLKKQFQNSDFFIYIKGIYIFFFFTATPLEDEEQQLRCSVSRSKACPSSEPLQRRIISKHIDQFTASVDPSSWFLFMGALLHFRSLRRLKTWFPRSMANARLNGLALPYIHKPTEIDSSSVLWDASGHRRIALPVSSIRRTINLIS